MYTISRRRRSISGSIWVDAEDDARDEQKEKQRDKELKGHNTVSNLEQDAQVKSTYIEWKNILIPIYSFYSLPGIYGLRFYHSNTFTCLYIPAY